LWFSDNFFLSLPRESASPEEILKKVFKVAIEKGVTDDLAGIIIKL